MFYEDKPPIQEVIALVIEKNENDIEHYGIKRRSGRYPWGSGKDPYQHSGDFYSRVNELRKANFEFTDPDTGKHYTGDTAIARSMGLSSTQFRTQYSLAKNEQRAIKVATAKDLRNKGYSLNEIAKAMGYENDSSVRSLLNEKSEIRTHQARGTADFIKQKIDEKGYIDIGKYVERELNVSRERLNEALEILRLEGYETGGGRVSQITNPKQKTTFKVIGPKGVTEKEIQNVIYNHPEKINSLMEYISRDDGNTFEKKFHYPASMDSKRLKIRYAEDGGINKDGVIELRRGVPDLDLKDKHYAQVRILVDNNKYIKGMAVYSDDMPDGIDVIFNTNKSKSTPKMSVLKDIKKDPDNPFGSAIKQTEEGGQYWYYDKNGKKKLGLLNKCREEGDWADWSDKLPSQFLSKQDISLAKKQLGLAYKDKVSEYNEIASLTNPTIKKKLLEDFANNCDSAAVHLYAAALPRQKHHVILPINDLKDNEIFAPRYENGEQVALIRYPHGGTFEIPILTVNNKQATARKVIGPDSIDAVGINKHVADRLSGADFDGDTVMVIPTNSKVKIKSTKELEGLKNFDPKIEYATRKVPNPDYTGAKGEEESFYYNSAGKRIAPMKSQEKQNQMGRISNLITDMTLQGATPDELVRAVKHSMVVIDAEKHHLDYKQSYIDNDIETLKAIYQPEGGASTLISRAKNKQVIPKRQGTSKINIKGEDWYDPSKPEGALIWKNADDLYYPAKTYNKATKQVTLRTTAGKKVVYDVDNAADREKYEPVRVEDPKTGTVYFTNKKGDIRYRTLMRTQDSTQMMETDDARTLISKKNTPMENLYADYANHLKSLANQARKEMVGTKDIEYSSAANKLYSKEVASIENKLRSSLLNKPKERLAQTIATSRLNAKKQDNPDMTKEEIKKTSQQEIVRARAIVGAKRTPIEINDREWEAIQSGAIHKTTLKSILDNADIDILREKATPRQTKTLSANQISRIKSMRNNGLTIQQIASALGVSTTTVANQLRGV